MKENFKGITKSQEVLRKEGITDLRTWEEKFADYLKTSDGIYTAFLILAIAMGFYGSLFEIPLIISGLYCWWLSFQKQSLPFKMPKSSNMLDPNDPPPGSFAPGKASGISYFGNERGTKKELWFNNGDMRTHIILFGSTGAGKALRMDEKILTPHGWVSNKQVQIGDFVCTPDGKTSPVIGVYPQGKLPLYRVNFSDGRNIEVSGDHLWEVRSVYEKVSKILNTKEIQENITKNFYIPLTQAQHQNQEDKKLPIPPYVMGSLLAGGKLSSSHIELNLSHVSNQDRIFILDKINTFLHEGQFTTNPFSQKQNYVIFKKTNSELTFFEQLKNLGLLDKSSHNLFVPEIYKSSSVKQKLALLQGFLDISGAINKKELSFTTTSVQVLQTVQEILFSLGASVQIKNNKIVPYFYQLTNTGNQKKLTVNEQNKYSYTGFIQYRTPKDLVSVKSKKDLLVHCKNATASELKIVSIDKTNKEEDCQCIKIADPRGLFITKEYIVTHNTEALVSLAFNALVQGSGFVYVDGKGDNSLWSKIFSLARIMGREDDLLVINYMTGSRDVFGPQRTKLSNTLNPFTTGSSGSLTELLVSLMDESGGDNAMWKGRAISLISSIMMALVDMRDRKEILLDVDTIREYLILEKIQNLSKRKDLPVHVTHSIRSYLRSLPGYQENTAKQSETVMDQHGYLQMQFTKILGSLADSYGYIFKTNLGEVDFWDVVLNRRILVVLLPALEKSPEELANLGKIIVACLKQMMAAGLGTTLEGTRLEVIDTKPTNSPAPFMCILDEYGYYAVKGAAVMPAQARSLGFSMIFAGQDYPALKKASPEEAASTLANCNIKIFMKLEDPEETYEIALKSAGRSMVAKKGSMEKKAPGMLGGLFPSSFDHARSANYEMEDRIQLGDLKAQREGEAHILFKDELVRADMFYAAPPTSNDLQLNHFLPVKPPEKEELLKLDDGIKLLQEKLLGEPFRPSDAEFLEIKLSQKLINEGKEKKEGIQKTIASIFGYLQALSDAPAENFRDSVRNLMVSDDEDDGKVNIFDKDIEDELETYKENNFDEDENNEDEDEQEERRRLIEKYGRREEGNRHRRPVREEIEPDDDDENEDDDDDDVFLNEDETKEKFREVERLSGSSEEESRMNADRLIEDIKAASEYPKRGVPDEQTIDDVLSIIKELNEDVKEDKD